jgi:hypothetical protein
VGARVKAQTERRQLGRDRGRGEPAIPSNRPKPDRLLGVLQDRQTVLHQSLLFSLCHRFSLSDRRTQDVSNVRQF